MIFDLGGGVGQVIKKEFCWMSSTSRRTAPRRRNQEMTSFERCVTEGNERGGRAGKRWCIAGWRRRGADQGQHSSAEKRGGLRSLAVCSQISLVGGGVARL